MRLLIALILALSVSSWAQQSENYPKAKKYEKYTHPAASMSLDACSHWFESGIQCNRKRLEMSMYCQKHTDEFGDGVGRGRTYVKGYYRKDGTYVRSHTRRR